MTKYGRLSARPCSGVSSRNCSHLSPFNHVSEPVLLSMSGGMLNAFTECMSTQAVEHLFCSITMHLASNEDVKISKELLSSSSESTLSKNGCIECSIVTDEADPQRVLYREQWQSESIFRQHVASHEFKPVLAAMDMCCEMPEVKIEKIVACSGLDSLREIYFEGTRLPQDIVCGGDDCGK